MGYEDVHAVVESVTDLPVLVVNTHGHCDHIYGNVYFDRGLSASCRFANCQGTHEVPRVC